MLENKNRWSREQTFNVPINGDIKGNAVTSTKLETAIKIAGILFDGSNDIVIPAANVGAYTKTETEKLIRSNKSHKGVDGWWQCGDTGLIIQWGIYNGTTGTHKLKLPRSFPNKGFWAMGQVYRALDYRDDKHSASAALVDNEYINVTIDFDTPTAWIAIGC